MVSNQSNQIPFWSSKFRRHHCLLIHLLINQFSFSTNQQARSRGTIMFKVVPITDRPVHNQTMVSASFCFSHIEAKCRHHELTGLVAALHAGHGGLQPAPRPQHPLRRRRHELQKRWRPGDRGPDGRPLVAGQETAQRHRLRRPRPLHQPAETVGNQSSFILLTFSRCVFFICVGLALLVLMFKKHWELLLVKGAVHSKMSLLYNSTARPMSSKSPEIPDWCEKTFCTPLWKPKSSC